METETQKKLLAAGAAYKKSVYEFFQPKKIVAPKACILHPIVLEGNIFSFGRGKRKSILSNLSSFK